MSGGASIRPLPEATSEDARSEALRKKSNMSENDKKEGKECTCPDKCEVHPKEKKPLDKVDEFYKSGKVIPPVPVTGGS